MKILLVEDDDSLLALFLPLIKKHLNESTVMAVGNGSEAISFIKENFVDLIITDIDMPVMDGKEMIKLLRSKYQNKFTKLYGHSGFIENENLKGQDRFIPKPTKIDDIIKIIKSDFEDC